MQKARGRGKTKLKPQNIVIHVCGSNKHSTACHVRIYPFLLYKMEGTFYKEKTLDPDSLCLCNGVAGNKCFFSRHPCFILYRLPLIAFSFVGKTYTHFASSFVNSLQMSRSS